MWHEYKKSNSNKTEVDSGYRRWSEGLDGKFEEEKEKEEVMVFFQGVVPISSANLLVYNYIMIR